MPQLAFLSWAAVSSKPQAEKESIHDQLVQNREFVTNLSRYYPNYTGYIVAEIQMVGSRSITELSEACDRYPREYGEMVRLIRSHAIDGIICRARDRLGRMDSLVVTIERLCLEHNIVVVPRQSPPISLDARYLRDSAGTSIHAAVDGHLSHFYVRQLVAHHKMGMFNRVVERKEFPNMLPWGYLYKFDADGNRYVEIDQAVAEIVRFILVECLLNRRLGRKQIIEECNGRGYLTKTGLAWNDGSVGNIIKNAWHYAGVLRVNQHSKTGRVYKEVQGEHPPILTPDEWDQIEREMERRKPTRISRVRPFAGCVICNASGKPMSGDCTTFREPRNGKAIHYSYQCNHCEYTHSIAQHRIEEAVRAALKILEECEDPASLLPLVDDDNTAHIEQRIAEIRKALNEIEGKKGKLIEMFISRTDIPQTVFDQQMGNLTHQEHALQMALSDQQYLLYAEKDRARSTDRLIELKHIGTDILDRIEESPEVVQRLIFDTMRIYVAHDGTRGKGGNMSKRTWVDKVVFI